MALTTLSDLKVILGNPTWTSDQNNQATALIDRVTSYIENKTGVSFSEQTDVVKRKTASPDGVIKLVEWPIEEVTLVHDIREDIDVTLDGWRIWFDGIDRIYGLIPSRVYDVTLSFGLADVPADIAGVAQDAVIRALNTEASGLKQLTVGDVTEIYGGLYDFPPGDLEIIEDYIQDKDSWQLSSNPPCDHGGFFGVVTNGPDLWGDCGC